MLKDDKKHIEGYLKGNQREFFEITSWIMVIVKNEYWGLKDHWADIIQDIRMKLFINLQQKKLRDTSSLKTYVYRISKYTCIDYLRKKYRTEVLNIGNVEVEDPNNNFSSLIENERKQILRRIIFKMTEKCRKTLELVFIEKLTYKKIGSLLHIAEGTVKSRVSRCIQEAIRLREKFAD